MNKELKQLIHQLKGARYPTSIHHDFFEHGEVSFDALLDLFGRVESDENQLANSMRVLFDMTTKVAPHRAIELFEHSLSFGSDSRAKIRAASLKTLVALIRLNRMDALFCPLNSIQLEKAKVLIAIGSKSNLEERDLAYLQEFLEEIKVL